MRAALPIFVACWCSTAALTLSPRPPLRTRAAWPRMEVAAEDAEGGTDEPLPVADKAAEEPPSSAPDPMAPIPVDVPSTTTEYAHDGDLRGRTTILEIVNGVAALPVEEQRRIKLEVGTNWPPRTTTGKAGTSEGPFGINRQGFMFFQGPTPLTAVQPDLKPFPEELRSVSLDSFSQKSKIIGAIFGATSLLVFVLLIIG